MKLKIKAFSFLFASVSLLFFVLPLNLQAADTTFIHPFPGGQNWLSDPGIFVEDGNRDWNSDGKDDNADRFGGKANDGILEWPKGIHYVGGNQGARDNVGGSIPEGCKLILQPGTKIIFAGASMSVGGTLVAKGTASEPITFTCSKPTERNWGGITFYSKVTNQTILEYCIIESGKSSWGMVQVVGDNDQR